MNIEHIKKVAFGCLFCFDMEVLLIVDMPPRTFLKNLPFNIFLIIFNT